MTTHHNTLSPSLDTYKLPSGFTLIELLISLALLGILYAFLVPGMQSLLLNSASAAASNQISSLVRFARNEAINHNTNVTLCPSHSGLACDNTSWQDGVLLFTDANHNSTVDSNDQVKRHMKPFLTSGSLTWRSLRNKVQFNGRGMTRGTAGSFVYCPPNNDEKLGASLVLSLQGRLRKGLDINNNSIPETGSHQDIECS